MTTLETINTDALYVPGLRFWKQTAPTRYRVVAQNANGAVEIYHALRDHTVGQVLAHSPHPIEGYDLTAECQLLGGTCHSRESFIGYRQDFLPLLRADDDQAVLKQLAAWHDACFAGTRVTA